MYKDLVQQRWTISHYLNTSYSDTGNITPLERKYLLQFTAEEIQKKNEMYEQIVKSNSK